MLLKKRCYVKHKRLVKGKEHEKEYSIPSFIKSSQGMDDIQLLISQEPPSKGTMKYESHIEDICKSLRMFSHHMIYKPVVTDEQIIQLMRNDDRNRWRDIIFVGTKFTKQLSDIGKLFAHVLIAVQDEEHLLRKIHEICTDDIVSSLSAECKKFNFKYNITRFYHYPKSITVSFLIHVVCNAPRLWYLRLFNCNMTGVTVNEIIDTLYEEGIVLELTYLDISENNLSEFKGSLAPLLVVAPKLQFLDISDCSLSGVDDMVKECSSMRVVLELTNLHISENNLKYISGSTLATLLAVAPKLNRLYMSNCSLTGAIMDDMVKECSSRGVVLELTYLNIRKNNLNDIKGSSLATLLAVAPKLNDLDMSDCSISGAVMDDMVKECSSRGVMLEIIDLNISGNNLNDIKGSSLATLLAVAPKLKYLDMSNCSFSGVDDMVKECSSTLVVSELTRLNISKNNLNDIKGSSLATLLAVAPKLKYLDMSNCSFSGVDDMVKECRSRGGELYI
ncbi:uncharacterized protein LOC117120320 isoform X2 [Anneissia japonica]|uniref:uncharacterized protein LOC117120320 isoform X2 n=1 Tax=Anneissia japonica TaxID=1529436 RepID=UPI001425693D|nr:uncharacterized protein LOC117120320 isoform X2 [Anneissia japonica]